MNNDKDMLKSIPVEDNTCTDVKPVRKAFGVAYLGVLEANNEYLLKKGFTTSCISLGIIMGLLMR